MGWSFDEAYNLVKTARPIVEINAGFECQLRAYHAANCDVYVAQQLLLRTRVRALHRQRELNAQAAQNALTQGAQGSNNSQPSAPASSIAYNTAPTRGLEHSTSVDSTGSMDTDGEGEHMQLPHHAPHPSTSTHASTSTNSTQPKHIRDNHKYDSFTYGSATAYHKENEAKYGHLHISKLTTQSEEDETEYTFCKTRSISDVYKQGMDPILDHNQAMQGPASALATNYGGGFTTASSAGNQYNDHEEDDPHTLQLLQQRHYIADSPSNTLHTGMIINTDNTSGASNNAGGFSRPRPMGLSIATNASNNSKGGIGFGFDLNINTGNTAEPTHLTTNNTTTTNNITNPSPLSFLHTTHDSTSSTPDYHSGLGSTALSSSANFMQGSGSHSGNRTHRASAGANRHKNTPGGGGSRGRRTRSSSNDDTHPPACRLSRPGSSVVRVIPPLRGLERQFLCSWCNTSLFTTANVIRTDLDLRALCDVFIVNSATALAAATAAAAGNSLAGQGKFSNGQSREGEEAQLQKIAQQEALLQHQQHHKHNHHHSTQESQHKPPTMPHFGLQISTNNNPSQSCSLSPEQDAKSVPGLNINIHINNHNYAHKDQPISPMNFANSLPLISLSNSGSAHNSPINSAATSSNRIGQLGNHKELPGLETAKKEPNGLLPKISLNRSAQGSSNNLLVGILSRNNSGIPAVIANTSNNNNNTGYGHSSGMEMDVDSPPKQNYDFDDMAVMTAPKPSFGGGQRTHRAAQSKAFDFELPFLDTTTNIITPYVPVKEPAMDAIEESGLENVGIAGSSKKVYHQDDSHLGISSNSAEFENTDLSSSSKKGQDSTSSSRRNSHLPALLHSKTTITQSTFNSQSFDEVAINEVNLFRDVPVQSSRRGSGNVNPINIASLPMYTSNSTPVISNTDLFTSPGTSTALNNANNGGSNPLHRLANLTVSTNTINGSPGVPVGFPHSGDKSTNPSPHSALISARSDESPRVHIPPHRQQHYQNLTHSSLSNINIHSSPSNINTGGGSVTPGLQHQLSAHLRPQSAEKRRWLERMNLLRQHSLSNPATHSTGATDTAHLMYNPTGMTSGLNADKVNRMAEADVAASQLIYSGDEKYFHIEYLEWMGTAPLQGSVSSDSANMTATSSADPASHSIPGESGELCCPSCKNVVGGYSWNPSVRMTLGGKLDAPIFKIHKHVVHQMDVQFDATPSSTPRVSDTVMHVDP
mmetsp:Transcript_62346/g.109874  ORF Transcript_62346/g.109874 Transcript_62346/m.109874 type:complete len:1214 (-) Transcript_62346:110-3751(-)